MRVCLLSYRAYKYSGGQGIYVRYLSQALQKLGHEVDVVAGPPYPDLAEGIKLINCNINNNYCYQNQMIIISTVAALGGNYNNAISTINTNIIDNTCGVISFLNSYETPQDWGNFNTTTQIRNQNDGLLISGNTCKMIASLDATGQEIGNDGRTSSINFITGSSVIENNTCSWIRPTLETLNINTIYTIYCITPTTTSCTKIIDN